MEPAPEKKAVRVTIFNQPYTLLASEEPGEVEALAHAVDELMTSIAARAGNIDSTRTAVLACLHLADQLRAAEKELAAYRQRIDTKTREFALLLDQVID